MSLITLVLDNRSDEMSPLVRQRMLHVRDQMLGEVNQILFFARLGAAHKDYIFESLSLLAFCNETIVQKMAKDLTIHLDASSPSDSGLVISLIFPKVNRKKT